MGYDEIKMEQNESECAHKKKETGSAEIVKYRAGARTHSVLLEGLGVNEAIPFPVRSCFYLFLYLF